MNLYYLDNRSSNPQLLVIQNLLHKLPIENLEALEILTRILNKIYQNKYITNVIDISSNHITDVTALNLAILFWHIIFDKITIQNTDTRYFIELVDYLIRNYNDVNYFGCLILLKYLLIIILYI